MTDQLRNLHLHFDCATGAAGDMMLGALIDLGVPIEVIAAALDAIGAGRARLQVGRVTKRGIAATNVTVDTAGEIEGLGHVHEDAKSDFVVEEPTEASEAGSSPAPAPDSERTLALAISDIQALVEKSEEIAEPARHPHTTPARRPTGAPHDHDHHDDHHHHHDDDHAHDHSHPHAHYHYSAIRQRITDAALTDSTKRRALDIFDRIARAESRIHNSSLAEVSFHEVGAIDSIVDIVGTAAALAWLDPASVSCSSVAMGHGTLTCAHGVLPVPAPAALEVLREAGGLMADGGVARELCTPTGAAILASAVTRWTVAPIGRPVAIGWGAGDAELADRANVLRAIAIDVSAAPAQVVDAMSGPVPASDAVWKIDANLDDMSPELCNPAADAMFSAGALDVWWTPIMMKKGRPALTVSALATEDRREDVIAAILRETTTIGVRYARLERQTLERSFVDVTTRYGTIAVKVAKDGGTIINAAPEYEACAAAARANGVPLKLVFAAALSAFDQQRS
ncbi:MAG: nickel pincer cofactor biosynthesis protein LarC [Kofleriaceae bacterium]